MSWFGKAEGKICPLIRGRCLQHGCEFYTHLIGQDPQTGAEKDEWGCVAHWVPIMLTEVSLKVRGNQAAVEKFRNELLKQEQQSHREILVTIQQAFEGIGKGLRDTLTGMAQLIVADRHDETISIEDGRPETECSVDRPKKP
ncbi:MAG: hypothetical protein ACE5H0_11565 [Bacteroidota bacterium]